MPTLCSARLPRLAFIITALLPVTGATTTCYYPNGSPVGNDEYTPCRNNTGYTMCCRTGGLVPDTCDENGLCYNICDQMGSGCHNNPGTFWRESCTDQSWQSPYCLQNLCTDKSANGTASDNVPVTKCPSTSKWCCGAMTSDDCCNSDDQFELPSMGVVSTSGATSTSATATTSTSMSTSTTLASPATVTVTNTPTGSGDPEQTNGSGREKGNGGLGEGGKIGLGVGLGVGIPAVAAIVAAMVYMRRKAKSTAMPALIPSDGMQERFEKPELDANATLAELHATYRPRPVELNA